MQKHTQHTVEAGTDDFKHSPWQQIDILYKLSDVSFFIVHIIIPASKSPKSLLSSFFLGKYRLCRFQSFPLRVNSFVSHFNASKCRTQQTSHTAQVMEQDMEMQLSWPTPNYAHSKPATYPWPLSSTSRQSPETESTQASSASTSPFNSTLESSTKHGDTWLP